jgi:hypothetical protein
MLSPKFDTGIFHYMFDINVQFGPHKFGTKTLGEEKSDAVGCRMPVHVGPDDSDRAAWLPAFWPFLQKAGHCFR